MKFFRKARETIFRKLRVTPKNTSPQVKVDRALIKIKATQKEARAILTLARAASERAEQRKSYNAKGNIEEDGIFITLKEKTYDVLGRRRAEEFFDMCNDPYF